MVSELRRYTRLPLDGSVGLKMENGRMVLSRMAFLDDVSAGGFRVSTKEEVRIGEDLKFHVTVPSLGHSIKGTGKVRNVMEIKRFGVPYYSLGVEFKNVKEDNVLELIRKKRRGWTKKIFIFQEHKRDVLNVLKLSPALLLITWFAMGLFNQADVSNKKDRAYTEQLRKGALHYLFYSN